MSTTHEQLLEAANRAGQTTQALRDAMPGTGAVLGDALLALVGRAAELKRDIARLAEAVRQDEQEASRPSFDPWTGRKPKRLHQRKPKGGAK